MANIRTAIQMTPILMSVSYKDPKIGITQSLKDSNVTDVRTKKLKGVGKRTFYT